MRPPLILAFVGVSCGLLGLLAVNESWAFAKLSIHAVISRDLATYRRLAPFAGRWHVAGLLLGLISIGLGLGARAWDRASRFDRVVGFSALCLGITVLMLSLVMV